MQLDEQNELTDHLILIVKDAGLALSSIIRFGMYPHDPETMKFRQRVESDCRILGESIAKFVIWIDNDELGESL